MRDPERIDPFLEKLGEIWKQVPDWRFGQVVMNLSRNERGEITDPWDCEEAWWERRMAEFEAPPELTEEEIRARAEELLRQMNLDPGGRDSFE